MAYALALAIVSGLAAVNSLAGEPAAAATATQEQSSSASVADALGIDGPGVGRAGTRHDDAWNKSGSAIRDDSRREIVRPHP